MLSFILNTDDPEQDGLLDSFFSSGKAISQELVRNDSVLAFQIVPVVPSVGETQLWDSDHLSTDTYLVAVGNEDEPPTGGTWPLTLGANTASAIAYNVTAAALQSALMAAGFGTLTVLLLQAGVYQVTWTANGAIAQMTSAANTLSPDSGVTVNVVAAGSASTQAVQVITLRQSVVAAAAPATQLPAAAIAATVTRAGSGTVNKIYALTMTAGTYGGTFSLTVTAATGAAQGLGVVDANISAEDFAALLATQTVIASTDNVSVQRVGTVLNVEFVGTQGLSNVPVIAVTNIDLLAPKGVSGTINFNTIPLNRAFWNTTETELTYRFAVRRTRTTGEEREFYNASVTLKRNLIDASTMVAVFTGGITIGTTGIIGGTSGRVLYDNAGVVGEISGATSNGTALTLVAPVLGAATATSINGVQITGVGTLSIGGTVTTATGGGVIDTSSGGGSISTYNGGGSINTSNSGGSINTTAGGSITTGAGSLTGPAGGGTIATNETISGGTLAGSFTTVNGSVINKDAETFHAGVLLFYLSTVAPLATAVLTVPGTIPAIVAADGVATRLQIPISASRWAGKTVKIGMVVTVNGTSAGNLACRFAFAYRNSALDGVVTTAYDIGTSYNGTTDTGAVAKAAPTVAGAMLLIQDGAVAIPSNVTALSLFISLERSSGLDTNTNTAYINEVRINEQ